MIGYLRETEELAIKASNDKNTGIHRTGLDKCLKLLFPEVEWIHDKIIGEINGQKYRFRPDYRSEELKMVVEFDGLPHYQSPEAIIKDKEHTKIMEDAGYKVIRIPYFVQLTKTVIKQLFDIDNPPDWFPDNTPSIGNSQADPAYLCPAGIKRMAEEFHKFPDQYQCNLEALKNVGNDFITGYSLLKKEYENMSIISSNCVGFKKAIHGLHATAVEAVFRAIKDWKEFQLNINDQYEVKFYFGVNCNSELEDRSDKGFVTMPLKDLVSWYFDENKKNSHILYKEIINRLKIKIYEALLGYARWAEISEDSMLDYFWLTENKPAKGQQILELDMIPPDS